MRVNPSRQKITAYSIMPSRRYIPIRRGHVNMRGMRVGGAVPILLDAAEKKPEMGGALSSNQFVGIITPQLPTSVFEGGKLLKHINFGHAPKNDNQRIKFIF